WKPYHYDISIGENFGVSLQVHFLFVNTQITAHIGADLHIWGPEFTGTADIHLWIVSFTIHFGSGSSQNSQAIQWVEFKQSFLGANDKICSISIASGSRKTAQDSTVVDSEHFSFITNSLIPSKEVRLPTEIHGDISELNKKFGVGMVCVDNDKFTSTHQISFKKDNQPYKGQNLVFEPITQAVSKSLWQNISTTADLTSQAVTSGTNTIDNVLVGYTIYPQVQKPDKTLPVALQNLLYSIGYSAAVIAYPKQKAVPTSDSFDQSKTLNKIHDTISKNDVRSHYLTILQASHFDIGTSVDVQPLTDNVLDGYFVEQPMLSYLGEEKPIQKTAA
ncbi:MAG: DUF6603 domain-containing protein, partial [Bacteroidota bacterium]